jgi:hypothetical protein
MLCGLFPWPTSDLDSFQVSSHSRKASRPGKGVQFSEYSHCDNTGKPNAIALWYQLLEFESAIANQSGDFSVESDRPYPLLPHLTLGSEKNLLPTE